MEMDKPNVGKQEPGSETRKRDEDSAGVAHVPQKDLIDFSDPTDGMKERNSEDVKIKQEPSKQGKGEKQEQNTSEEAAAENKWYWELLELDLFLQGPKTEREAEDAAEKEIKVKKLGGELENLKIGLQPEEPELEKKGGEEQSNTPKRELKSEATGEVVSETERGAISDQPLTLEQEKTETENRPIQEERDISERLRTEVRERKIRRALIQAGLRIEGEKLELLKLIYAPRTRKELERLQKLDISQWRDRNWEEQVRKVADCFKKEEERIEKK